jgi:hypothetical protein
MYSPVGMAFSKSNLPKINAPSILDFVWCINPSYPCCAAIYIDYIALVAWYMSANRFKLHDNHPNKLNTYSQPIADNARTIENPTTSNLLLSLLILISLIKTSFSNITNKKACVKCPVYLITARTANSKGYFVSV